MTNITNLINGTYIENTGLMDFRLSGINQTLSNLQCVDLCKQNAVAGIAAPAMNLIVLLGILIILGVCIGYLDLHRKTRFLPAYMIGLAIVYALMMVNIFYLRLI